VNADPLPSVTPLGAKQVEPGPRGLDHVVHAVRELEQAAQCYSSLGFRVGSRNHHPWGTQNRIVQLPGFFVELLALGQPQESLGAEVPGFSFAMFIRKFLNEAEGLAMVALESRDAIKDGEAFRQAGIVGADSLRFEREGRAPDGTPVRVGFSLAFASDKAAPRCGFFLCEQRDPKNFWNPNFQVHPNGACGVLGIVLVAANPSQHLGFLTRFVGGHDVSSNGTMINTPRGGIELLDPTSWRLRYGIDPPDLTGGARLAAIRFLVRDLDVARTVLRHAKVPIDERRERLIVAPGTAYGATLVFEPERVGSVICHAR
jgi:Glyoxalase-like domain